MYIDIHSVKSERNRFAQRYRKSRGPNEDADKIKPEEKIDRLKYPVNTGPVSSVGRVSAPSNGRSWVQPSRAATYHSLKMVLAAPCGETFGVEQELVDPHSG